MELSKLFFLSAAAILFAQIISQQQLKTATVPVQRGKKIILLDNFFNNELKKDTSGSMSHYHYTWNDKKNSGFSKLGEIFVSHGGETKMLEEMPTAKNLKQADVYIIVDPDTEKETAKPNFMNTEAARIIASWVHSGGVLMLMGNDAGNSELKNFNILASKFGIHFNEDNFNRVVNNQYEQGAILIPPGNSVFKTARKIFIKELSTLQVSDPAMTILSKEGKNIIAIANYGKGTVFAIGDPWLYNEYVNGRLPADFDNTKAAEDLVEWLLSRTKKQ